VYQCDDGAAEAIVALNNGRDPRAFRPAAGRTFRLALATDRLTELDGDTLVLPPFGGAVLMPREGPTRYEA